jgi:effector-binding domain-containing protein
MADPVVVSSVVRRTLLEQPVLRIRSVWDPADPGSGAGPDLAEIDGVRERQGLVQAGAPYVCGEEPDERGLVRGEVGVPVDRLGSPEGRVEVVVQPATEAVSGVYRDNIHLTAGEAVVQQLVEYTDEAGLTRIGRPRWIYYTDPTWNLHPDDHLVEVLWLIA